MQAKSGLRKLYKAQIYVALAFGLLVTFLLLTSSEFDWRNVLFWMGCLFAGLCTLVIYDLLRPEHLLSEISVDESGISFRFKAPDSLETIPFSEIETIKVRRRRYLQCGTPVNDGYCDTILYLKNGKTAIISQDYFENYHEIMLAIYKNYSPKPKSKALFGRVLRSAVIVMLFAGVAS